MSDYTDNMVAAIRNASPLTFEMAQQLANTDAFQRANKTHRSIIAKAKSLGIDYIPKAKPLKKAKGLTKSDLVNQIAVALGADSADFDGLDKATMSALNGLLERIA